MIPYIHYYAELALWIAVLFLAGCPLGAFARWLSDRWRRDTRAVRPEGGPPGEVS